MTENIKTKPYKMTIFMSIIITGLFSGLFSVFLMSYLNEKNELYNLKLETLTEFVGNRYDVGGEKFTQALNKAFILFSDSDEVLKAIKNFHDDTRLENRIKGISNQKLLEIFKAMCNELDINIDYLNDDFFFRPFTVKK